MKHLSQIQSEFVKEARKWDEMSLEDQKAYLKRHPKSKRKLRAPGHSNSRGSGASELVEILSKYGLKAKQTDTIVDSLLSDLYESDADYKNTIKLIKSNRKLYSELLNEGFI